VKFGVVLPQAELGTEVEDVRRFALEAEQAGFSYIVAYDHVLGADRTTRPDWPYSYDAVSPFHEPLTLFAFLAGLTSLELVTGVLVLPQRQTALVAKQAAEVDVLSNGRLRLGVGLGYNEVEFEGLGASFADRTRRYEEQIHLLRLLWTRHSVEFAGEFHTIDRAGICPLPVQRPIPIWLGCGTAPQALDRVGRLADGWIALGPPGTEVADAWSRVREAAAGAGRAGTIELQGTAQPGGDRISSRPFDPMPRNEELDVLTAMAVGWSELDASHVSVSGLGCGRTATAHVDFVVDAGRVLGCS
jgi:probable F420-dependent oxidoreductase